MVFAVWRSSMNICTSISCFCILIFFFFGIFCRAAPSARSPCLHRACVHCATSGCAISAPTCISTRDHRWRLSTQTCTHSRGPVPSSVLTCTRKAPVPFLQMDKAWNEPLSLLAERLFFFFIFPAVLHLFVSHFSVRAVAMNNAWDWRWLITVPGYPCALLHLSLTHGPDSKALKWFHFC